MSALAKRYARAAVSVAHQRGSEAAEALLSGLQSFQQAYCESAELREVLHNPALRDVQRESMQAVTTKLALSAEAVRLLTLLCEGGRLQALDEVVQETQAAVDELLGRVRAQVITAVALSSQEEQRLTQALSKRCARPVTLNITIDPTIIGGLVCRVGDLTIDSSVRRKLESLRGRL